MIFFLSLNNSDSILRCFSTVLKEYEKRFRTVFSFSLESLIFKMHWIYTFQLYKLKDKRQLIGGLEEIDQKAFISCLQFSTMVLTVIENISRVLGASPVYC